MTLKENDFILLKYVFLLIQFADIKTYLSNVNATIFQVDDANNPQSINLVFHMTHSIVPRIPSLYKEYVSLIVNVVKSKTVEAAISRKLYMEKILKKCP